MNLNSGGILLFALVTMGLTVPAGEPVVEYVNISQRSGTKLVDIEYSVVDPDGDEMVIVATGRDVAKGIDIPMKTLSGNGANGDKITSGVHHLVWDAGADWDGYVTDDFRVTIHAGELGGEGREYLIIDISGESDGVPFPATYLAEAPPDLLTNDVYKTTKIVLRWVPAENFTFTMGSPILEIGRESDETEHQVTFTRDFYIGVFEVTQRQWELVMGSNPSKFRMGGDGEGSSLGAADAYRPVENISWNDIRGGTWPHGGPANGTFIGNLRLNNPAIVFDLPTEAQWEYACRAGTSTALNSGKNLTSIGTDANLDEVAWYSRNNATDDEISGTKVVGRKRPNNWGLYDLHGNVWEWCLDWYPGNFGTADVTDPVGGAAGSVRVRRGGSWNSAAPGCRSADRDGNSPGGKDSRFGFRLAVRAGP